MQSFVPEEIFLNVLVPFLLVPFTDCYGIRVDCKSNKFCIRMKPNFNPVCEGVRYHSKKTWYMMINMSESFFNVK